MTESGQQAADRRVIIACICTAGLISLFNGLTTGGIVVSILLSVPIIAASAVEDRRGVWVVFAAAWLGFVLAAMFGPKPLNAVGSDLPNHVFVMLTLGASAYVGLMLQHRRLDAQAARDAAIDARETNRLLMSLIAHDLRAPLATALHAFDYLEVGGDVGDDLISEIRGRLKRSLRVVDAFLSMRHGGKATPPEMHYITARQVAAILTEEVRAFEPEAIARQKTLELDTGHFEDGTWMLDVMVLRQVLTILIDNAVRHAVPGPIRVHAELADGRVMMTVQDSGPGLPSPTQGGGKGIGLGLELCDALVRRSGGSLDVQQNQPGGTTFMLRIPIRPAEAALVGG